MDWVIKFLVLVGGALTTGADGEVWGGFTAPRLSREQDLWELDTETNSWIGEFANSIQAANMTIGNLTETLTAEYLDTIDVFFTSLLGLSSDGNGVLSLEEQDILKTWVKYTGGVLICSANSASWSDSYRSFGSPFDLASGGFMMNMNFKSVPNPDSNHSLADGINELEFFEGSTFLVFTDDAEVVFKLYSSPTVAVLEDIQPGGGDVIMWGDFDIITNAYNGYSDNGKFTSNLMDWVLERAPIKTPTIPTDTPTEGPTEVGYTYTPSDAPSESPTGTPTVSPSGTPTVSPTQIPTVYQTQGPTVTPTGSPSDTPTYGPTKQPTYSPTGSPTGVPTHSPTGLAPDTVEPTVDGGTYSPTGSQTEVPTQLIETSAPTVTPTLYPQDGTEDVETTDNDQFSESSAVRIRHFVTCTISVLLFIGLVY